MWKAGHMGKVGWIWMGTYLLVDLEGCPAAKFPGVEYICGGNCSKALQSFGQVSRESAAEDRQGFCLVLALAVSARELISGEVQVPFHSGSRWGLLMRTVRSALHRFCSCGNKSGCFCWV